MVGSPAKINSAGLFAAMIAAAPRGRRTFLRSAGGTGLTYDQMFARSAQMANALWQAGVRPGDRVAVLVHKSAEALLLYLACLRAGAVYLPLNPAYTQAELEYYLGDGEPACVVTWPDREDPIRCIAMRGSTVLTLSDNGQQGSLVTLAREVPETFEDVSRSPGDLAAILYTSGTTGRSKGAMLTHANLESNARTLAALWHFTENDVLLHALPIYHTHGLFTATNTVLMAGASVIFLPRFDLDEILAELPHATVMMGVPTFYTRLLADRRFDRKAVAHMRLFVSGSAPLLTGTHRDFFACTGHAILERYGMTETNMIASNPYDGERVSGTVGFPLPGVEVRISDQENGATLSSGETGMIEVRGPNVCKGYWRKPEQTAQSFRPNAFFVTGDLGTIDRKGYLRIVGRAKDLVISGGLNIYPGEIEREIDSLAGVGESAVIGVPHPDLGEALTAIVVRKAECAIGEPEILAELAARLARYKLPKRILFAGDLPRNAMGKVQKDQLRNIHRRLYGAS